MTNRHGTWAPALLAVFCLLGIAPLEAGAPMVKTQPPAYYRLMLGDFEVTALLDGTFTMPIKGLLNGVSDAQLQHDLTHAFLKDPYEISVNAFLVNTGSKLVLIDTGDGAHMSADTGRLIANLKAAGYDPAQVDEIYITHMHGDHIGGLSHKGERLFPNAIVRASREEADYWLKAENLAAASDDAKASFQHAIDWLEPYVRAGKFLPFDGDVDARAGCACGRHAGPHPGTHLLSGREPR